MTKTQIRALAERIAADLFTNGAGERAGKLVLTPKDAPAGFNSLGGWSESAVANRIADALSSWVREADQ